jgi:predicted nuclease of predicted toxin-antitoxin system
VSVRLLLDENLPPDSARDLADAFPRSAHVRDLGLQSASDDADCSAAARPTSSISPVIH